MQTKDSFYNIAKELETAQENEGYLIVIRCGAFFTSIGANAIALSNELGLKLTCWKKGLCKAGVPINALYNYVKRLDSLGYNYVIYNYSKDEIINNGKKYAECYRFEGKPIDKSNLLLACKDCEYYEKSYNNIDIFTDMKRIQEFKDLKEKQEKIEKMGKILMPILIVLLIGISIFSITLSYTDEATGVTRTGLQGLKLYLIPNFKGVTLKQFFLVIMDAMGQLFYSISVAMGIMVAYGSYVPDKTNINKSINHIEFFDTLVAILAGLMIVPAVFVFAGTEGMSAGPGLMFISLPKVFNQMGKIGIAVGILFFLMVIFAAVSSSVSVMEAVVASIMDKFKLDRKKSAIIVTAYAVIFGIIVCLGYNVFYFELKLPNGSVGQILDVFDYFSNNILMPIVAILTCVLIGWVAKPKTIIDEVTKNGEKFGRKFIYIAMVKVIAPVLLVVLLLQALGVF